MRVIVYCLSCGSKDVTISNNQKYLICDSCKEEVYIRDLEIGIAEEQ